MTVIQLIGSDIVEGVDGVELVCRLLVVCSESGIKLSNCISADEFRTPKNSLSGEFELSIFIKTHVRNPK